MQTPSPSFSTIPGREVLALAIRDFDARAEYGRSVGDAYGMAAVGSALSRNIGLDDATATVLRVLASRAAVSISSLPTDKDGKPRFVDKLRHEIVCEIVNMFVGAYRAAYVKIPVEHEETHADAA